MPGDSVARTSPFPTLSYERLIAHRFLRRDKSNFSRPLVNIATYTVALGVVVMILSVCILRGFQREITAKVTGFGSHITIRSYGWVNDYDEIPISLSPSELNALSSLSDVAHIQPFAYKGGMMKTDNQIHGIIFKGLAAGFDSSFFKNSLVKGRLFRHNDTAVSNEVIISQRLADKMNLDTGDKTRLYFWVGDNYRARLLRVTGIYNTDLSEFDNHYLIGDIALVQKLNNWDCSPTNTMCGGYEIKVNNFSHLDDALLQVKYATRPDLAVTSIVEEQPSMFAWLDLLNSNIILILIVMAAVCSVSVISALLIMIFEKTAMIGILKTLGSTNRSIRRIFMLKAVSIVGRGVVFGNIIALVLCLLQANLHILKLDPDSYSMPFVPVDTNPWFFLVISIATIVVCSLALLIPSTYIAHIDPAKSIRGSQFE